ncbi:MAG TPA: chromosome segregation protein SMC [Casimicrobiaceae bacterium]|nr:chromosome segregation protein SMC [Casimicrobiaceae bacterium]
MRLTQIKLAGFKSFVDPTQIATPGQLVGIVGPNGCGKSNVIDAVRWVLGESKASALRGESMQDVIFNGAGDRKPVGRASVELHFDNAAGRIGGQWGQYAEISIKRMLSRDGDSSYYINNIPVRRRDIHDLFLGTGLGPRAYAIIEQGMISRVVEARPEELRVFLEEAAGVSKYRERRKETEGRLADARENLSRVEDIRAELASQIERLAQQAKVASDYRDHEARLKHVQQLLWYSKQQDAVRSRERLGNDVASLVVALESLQADLRQTEARIETQRSEHYAAGDALHERQGAFYATNAELTRLEQQLKFARDSDERLARELTQIHEELSALSAQQLAVADERTGLDALLERTAARRDVAAREEADARDALPALDDALTQAERVFSRAADKVIETEQAIRVTETRREHATSTLEQSDKRLAGIAEELAALDAPALDAVRTIEDQLAQEANELADREQSLSVLQIAVQSLQERERTAAEDYEVKAKRLADLDAREQALSALQAKVGHGSDRDSWLADAGLADATPLWRALDVEPGWNDALEATLRDRLEALEVAKLTDALAWEGTEASPPVRLVLYADTPSAPSPSVFDDALIAKVRLMRPALARLIADALHGVRCRPSIEAALDDLSLLNVGEAFVTPEGHLVTAQTVTLFRPDGALHGVLERQRELVMLADGTRAARHVVAEARRALDALREELRAQQQAWHAESLALGSQQRRVNDLKVELVQARQAAEAAQLRRTQLLDEQAQASGETREQRAMFETIGREIADLQSRAHDEYAERDRTRHLRNEAEVTREKGRERLRLAERTSQEAGFDDARARDRVADLERRESTIAASAERQQTQAGKLKSERESVDFSPLTTALERQVGLRNDAEAALKSARDHLESLGAALREAEEARLAIDRALEPARQKIGDARLKEQAALIAEQQYAEQLAEAQADVAALPEALKAFGPKSQLAGEIDRLQKAIAELGAVNLAALDELAAAEDRKGYLDRQAADLVEAMTTLECAIREIDRESRQLLQQTFDVVNDNLGKLFPVLFGGGTAKLVLTGDEILDSGVAVVAQPPGKRNTSIHLLSGGEKALTATSLVFAIFQLNPAPFCLLDEVDAPLDDTNTERFCAMVRDMARETQFLFISHNKITMEMAEQLVGITMPEPGISRVVAVDIAEAVDLARIAGAVAAAA